MCSSSPPPLGKSFQVTPGSVPPPTNVTTPAQPPATPDPVPGGLWTPGANRNTTPSPAPVPGGLVTPPPLATGNGNNDSMRLLTGYAQSGGNPNPNAKVGDVSNTNPGAGFDAPGYGTFDSRGTAAVPTATTPNPVNRPATIPAVPIAAPAGSTNPISRGEAPAPTPSPVVTPSPAVVPVATPAPAPTPAPITDSIITPTYKDTGPLFGSGIVPARAAAPVYGDSGAPAADGAVGNITNALMRRYQRRLWV